MNIWIMVLVLFFAADSDKVSVESLPLPQKEYAASNGSVGLCRQAPCIWQ